MDISLKLPERLQEIMSKKKMNASDLAKQLDASTSTISRYLRGERLPSYSSFIKLLEVLNCSADFLIGLVDEPPAEVRFYAVGAFSDRFERLMKERHMSQYALHRITNFSYDNFNKWLKGETAPYVDNLIKLSQAFNCSVDYLLGRVK